MPEDQSQDIAPERSRVRRYAGAVSLGVILGTGLLYVLSRFAVPAPSPVANAEPPACTGGTETIECLLATVESKWQVTVGSEASDGAEDIRVPVGSRLRWQVTSKQRGLLTSFLVEEDGGVLLIYPSPGGEMPVLEAGAEQLVPRPADRAMMTWSRAGLRRVFAFVSTTPFVVPQGQAVGEVATYYAPAAPSASFFAELRNQVFQDQVSRVGEWALGEARFVVLNESQMNDNR